LDPTILPSHAYHAEQLELALPDAIYLSGVTEKPKLSHLPYVTGFAYHFRVVTHSLAVESYALYTEWLEHTLTYKRILREKGDG
jgi:hypothetical protein